MSDVIFNKIATVYSFITERSFLQARVNLEIDRTREWAVGKRG